MENASKALEIAAGVLLAVLIMSLIAYFFTSISSWPEQQDDEKMVEQTAKFNLEYEVYDKKGMYGADVISCLTKAINNNEKYYDGGSFLSGYKYGEKYWVNVYVNIKSDLREEIIVYCLARDIGVAGADTGIYKQQQRFTTPTDPETGVKLNLRLDIFGFDFSGGYTKFSNTDDFKYESPGLSRVLTGGEFIDTSAVVATDSSTGEIKEYNAILYSKKGDGSVDTSSTTPLQVLVKTADSNLKQIVTNDGTKQDFDIWSTAEWRTALYDFKTRRFRCDNMKYSEITGRVNEIYFSEM